MVAVKLEVALVCVRVDSGLDYLVNNKTINTFFVQALQKVGIEIWTTYLVEEKDSKSSLMGLTHAIVTAWNELGISEKEVIILL